MDKNFEHYFLEHIPTLWNRDYLIEIFTLPDRTVVEHVTETTARLKGEDPKQTLTTPVLYEGKLVVIGDTFFEVTNYAKIPNTFDYLLTIKPTHIKVPKEGPLCTPQDRLELKPGLLSCYTGTDPLPTSIGRIVLNFFLIERPFNGLISYMNTTIDGDGLGEVVRQALLDDKITTKQYNDYSTNLFFIGHSPEFYSPNITPRALMTTPDLHKIRDDDIRLYKKALEDGDAVEMARLEQKWIGLDKKGLKGDPSLMYLRSGKQFNVVRKKLYVTYGMVEVMGQKGHFTFVPKSLEEGWTQDALPTIASETRSGSYSRGIETADGGTVSNDILKVFQNTRVTQKDCKTKRRYDLTIFDGLASQLVYRYYTDDKGAVQTITPSNYKDLVGKTINLRSPTTCEAAQEGYCFVCMGKVFERLDQRVMAASVVELGAYFSTLALKKMHGSSVSTTTITSLNKFTI